MQSTPSFVSAVQRHPVQSSLQNAFDHGDAASGSPVYMNSFCVKTVFPPVMGSSDFVIADTCTAAASTTAVVRSAEMIFFIFVFPFSI